MDDDFFNKLKLIGKKYNLDLFILFGSRAKGNFKDNSDYDLAYLKINIDYIQEDNLIKDLELLFEDKKFDLVNLDKDRINSIVLENEIFTSGILIFESKKNIFEVKKENIFFDYIDSKDLLEPTKQKFLDTAI